MTINDLIKIYETKKKKYGTQAYRHISNVLTEAKELHGKDFLESKKAREKISKGEIPDHEQSWRAFKGKNLEKVKPRAKIKQKVKIEIFIIRCRNRGFIIHSFYTSISSFLIW